MRPEPGGSVALVDAAGERQIEFAHHRNAYEVTLESFVAAVTTGGDPAISGVEGLRALAVALAVKESSGSGRAVVVRTEPPGNAPL
jgi:1,5-anhydro-D-fructose reductase (1,5-anhydro-D-mannitol-forming)